MPYSESDLLPLSGLQHLVFCERQCALIHVEQLWDDNRFTAEGNVLHKKAHEGKHETRSGERITRGVPLQSLQLGLIGVADVVLWRPPEDCSITGVTLRQAILNAATTKLSAWDITPVEYKRGRPKKNDCDRVQLCAQALCLEEMLGVRVEHGQIFYGTTRRRVDVMIDEQLRDTTRASAARFHEIIGASELPVARREKKCESCSLYQVCLPPSSDRPPASSYVGEIC